MDSRIDIGGYNRRQLDWSRSSSCLKMASEPEGWILGSDWGLRAFAIFWINRLKMIMTRNDYKITRLMGLSIMQASKNFKSNRLLRIFEDRMIFWTLLWNTWINWGWADTRQARVIIRRGIHVAKNCKAVGTKYSWNNREDFMVSCNNKTDWE